MLFKDFRVRRIFPSYISRFYKPRAIKPRTKLMDTIESVVLTTDESEWPVYITSFKEITTIQGPVTSRGM